MTPICPGLATMLEHGDIIVHLYLPSCGVCLLDRESESHCTLCFCASQQHNALPLPHADPVMSAVVPCTGFEDLYSFAFIGNSGRIGTASDGLFSYVPAGPNKQIDMFLRAYDLRKEGRLEV